MNIIRKMFQKAMKRQKLSRKFLIEEQELIDKFFSDFKKMTKKHGLILRKLQVEQKVEPYNWVN